MSYLEKYSDEELFKIFDANLEGGEISPGAMNKGLFGRKEIKQEIHIRCWRHGSK